MKPKVVSTITAYSNPLRQRPRLATCTDNEEVFCLQPSQNHIDSSHKADYNYCIGPKNHIESQNHMHNKYRRRSLKNLNQRAKQLKINNYTVTEQVFGNKTVTKSASNLPNHSTLNLRCQKSLSEAKKRVSQEKADCQSKRYISRIFNFKYNCEGSHSQDFKTKIKKKSFGHNANLIGAVIRKKLMSENREGLHAFIDTYIRKLSKK